MNPIHVVQTMRSIAILLIWLVLPELISAQAVSTVESRDILTYPYGDPNPVPVLTEGRSDLYPYHTFSGYALKGSIQKHTVVKLENDYIEVYILPADGGKVWGAIEKSTGKEFIYRNDVIKYRNISMRGPWTSGGIEFNFGIIGHSPSTAAPVDYLTRKNDDGSVSCFVGNMDLPSRTEWRIEIRLPADKAFFETRVFWNNASPLPQPYYNWMTAAAVVSDDLVLQYPGNRELGHPGNSGTWPADTDGRNKARYADNVLKPSMSYHVVGEYNDFMGGYYLNSDFGFGHWALYDEMPGRKAWLWSQSRSGAIWEDLLTDSDGQYMEFQAGRMLNQYSPDPSEKTPITRTGFAPGATDQWRDIWFPVKDIGGFKEVSPFGALNVTEKNGQIEIGINALAATVAKITVKSDDSVVYREEKSFKPMEVFRKTVELRTDKPYEVLAEGMDLLYSSVNRNAIRRPFVTKTEIDKTTPSGLYFEGMELKENRTYAEAGSLFLQCLQKDPHYLDAMAALAELHYRSALYDSALYYANRTLQIDTYHPAANYFAGITYLAKSDFVNALESLGWAARSMEYRSRSYELMAGIELRMNNFELAEYYASLSLDFNRYNLNALKTLAVMHRLKGETALAEKEIAAIQSINPLDHFAGFESCLLHPGEDCLKAFSSGIRNEFPWQTLLEISLAYEQLGLKTDALSVLQTAQSHPLIAIRNAWLQNNPSFLQQAAASSPAFIFPYRPETIALLSWAVRENKNWKFRYYLALNLWALQREEEAREQLMQCGTEPDYAPFYLARAAIMVSGDGVKADLQKANQIAPEEWRTHYRLIEYLEKEGRLESALPLSALAAKKFGTNPMIVLQYAAVLLHSGQSAKCLKTLEGMVFLPSEGSDEGRVVFEQACISLALDLIDANRFKEALVQTTKAMEWPENLGAGKPYDPDNRVQDYLASYCLMKMKRLAEAKDRQNAVLEYNAKHIEISPVYNLLALQIYKERGETTEAESLLQRIEKSTGIDEVVKKKISTTYMQEEANVSLVWERRDFYGEIIRRILELQ